MHKLTIMTKDCRWPDPNIRQFLYRCLEVPRCCLSFNVAQHKGINNTGPTSSLDPDKDGRSYTETAKVKESLLLTKFYCLSAGVLSHLLSASDGTMLNVPFEVSDQEKEVILNQRSTFILGRSGTGKTTVLVMKLFQKEQQHDMASEGLDVIEGLVCGSSCNDPDKSGASLCQLFVTVNPKLCFAVKHHIYNLRRSVILFIFFLPFFRLYFLFILVYISCKMFLTCCCVSCKMGRTCFRFSVYT